MADGPRPAGSRGAAFGGFVRRLGASYRGLENEQRTAGYAAAALFVTMFLPWYSQTVLGNNPRGDRPNAADGSLTAWGAFSFVEAAVLLVAIGVLWMLFARGEGKAFHLPFGDGNVIFAAGLWVCALVFYRNFDKPSPEAGAGVAVTVGVSWGIFVTFLVGLFLAASGQRLRSARLVEPPLPGDVAPSDDPLPRGRRRPGAAEASAAARRASEPAATDATAVAPPALRKDPPADADRRRRPEPDSSQTVVDRRGPSTEKTLFADEVTEFPAPRRTPAPPPDTAPTRIVDAEDILGRDEDPGRP
ncbi:hypothetical protein DSM112329_01534 [Paraconexibacter sp. AEG42_29]|uniref:DUF805 domain-containing protein n=1 Tax=Paraconexibacter sp. AEG42_29 TaxID=2997339 RepID=A0AAU7ASW8_9ACTN